MKIICKINNKVISGEIWFVSLTSTERMRPNNKRRLVTVSKAANEAQNTSQSWTGVRSELIIKIKIVHTSTCAVPSLSHEIDPQQTFSMILLMSQRRSTQRPQEIKKINKEILQTHTQTPTFNRYTFFPYWCFLLWLNNLPTAASTHCWYIYCAAACSLRHSLILFSSNKSKAAAKRKTHTIVFISTSDATRMKNS